jgi:hypothetical protein
MVKAPALSILPMIAFRDALCITHNPVNGTVSQGRVGPARVAGCPIILRTPVGIIRKAALCKDTVEDFIVIVGHAHSSLVVNRWPSRALTMSVSNWRWITRCCLICHTRFASLASDA